MTLKIKLSNPVRKTAWLLLGTAVCALLSAAALLNLLAGVLTDPRANVRKDLLAAAIGYAPSSATLNARLAEAEMAEDERDVGRAEELARRAVNLSPWDYRHRLLLATIDEARANRAAAEDNLQEALAL